eukprot:g83362.t1
MSSHAHLGVVVTPEGRRLFGLDAELYLKEQKSRDREFEDAIMAWVQEITQRPLADPTDYWVCLQNGVLLCELINVLKPGKIKKFNKVKLHPLYERENIQLFLKAAWELGVPSDCLFHQTDLVSGRGMRQVFFCLAAVARLAPTFGWKGRVPAQRANQTSAKAAGDAVAECKASVAGGTGHTSPARAAQASQPSQQHNKRSWNVAPASQRQHADNLFEGSEKKLRDLQVDLAEKEAVIRQLKRQLESKQVEAHEYRRLLEQTQKHNTDLKRTLGSGAGGREGAVKTAENEKARGEQGGEARGNTEGGLDSKQPAEMGRACQGNQQAAAAAAAQACETVQKENNSINRTETESTADVDLQSSGNVRESKTKKESGTAECSSVGSEEKKTTSTVSEQKTKQESSKDNSQQVEKIPAKEETSSSKDNVERKEPDMAARKEKKAGLEAEGAGQTERAEEKDLPAVQAGLKQSDEAGSKIGQAEGAAKETVSGVKRRDGAEDSSGSGEQEQSDLLRAASQQMETLTQRLAALQVQLEQERERVAQERERAEEQRERAEELRERAEEERERAAQEAKRAEQERKRAEQETVRAEQEREHAWKAEAQCRQAQQRVAQALAEAAIHKTAADQQHHQRAAAHGEQADGLVRKAEPAVANAVNAMNVMNATSPRAAPRPAAQTAYPSYAARMTDMTPLLIHFSPERSSSQKTYPKQQQGQQQQQQEQQQQKQQDKEQEQDDFYFQSDALVTPELVSKLQRRCFKLFLNEPVSFEEVLEMEDLLGSDSGRRAVAYILKSTMKWVEQSQAQSEKHTQETTVVLLPTERPAGSQHESKSLLLSRKKQRAPSYTTVTFQVDANRGCIMCGNKKIMLKEIVAIMPGLQTSAAKAHAAVNTDPKLFVPHLCFSIVWEKAFGQQCSIDLQLGSPKQANRWVSYLTGAWQRSLLGTHVSPIVVNQGNFDSLLFLLSAALNSMKLHDVSTTQLARVDKVELPDFMAVQVVMTTARRVCKLDKGEMVFLEEFMGNSFALFPHPFWEEHFWRLVLKQAKHENVEQGGEDHERWLCTKLRHYGSELCHWGLASKGIKEFFKYMHYSADLSDATLFALLRSVDGLQEPDTKLGALLPGWRPRVFARSTHISPDGKLSAKELTPAEAARELGHTPSFAKLRMVAKRLEAAASSSSPNKQHKSGSSKRRGSAAALSSSLHRNVAALPFLGQHEQDSPGHGTAEAAEANMTHVTGRRSTRALLQLTGSGKKGSLREQRRQSSGRQDQEASGAATASTAQCVRCGELDSQANEDTVHKGSVTRTCKKCQAVLPNRRDRGSQRQREMGVYEEDMCKALNCRMPHHVSLRGFCIKHQAMAAAEESAEYAALRGKVPLDTEPCDLMMAEDENEPRVANPMLPAALRSPHLLEQVSAYQQDNSRKTQKSNGKGSRLQSPVPAAAATACSSPNSAAHSSQAQVIEPQLLAEQLSPLRQHSPAKLLRSPPTSQFASPQTKDLPAGPKDDRPSAAGDGELLREHFLSPHAKEPLSLLAVNGATLAGKDKATGGTIKITYASAALRGALASPRSTVASPAEPSSRPLSSSSSRTRSRLPRSRPSSQPVSPAVVSSSSSSALASSSSAVSPAVLTHSSSSSMLVCSGCGIAPLLTDGSTLPRFCRNCGKPHRALLRALSNSGRSWSRVRSQSGGASPARAAAIAHQDTALALAPAEHNNNNHDDGPVRSRAAPKEREQEVRTWIEQVLNVRLADDTFEALRSGEVICSLLNRLVEMKTNRNKAWGKAHASAVIKPIHHSQIAFRQMENINHFLSALYHFGIQPKDSFQTIDLYEGKDMRVVFDCLLMLKTRTAEAFSVE